MSKRLDGGLEASIPATSIIVSRVVCHESAGTVCAAVQQFLTIFEVRTVDPKGDKTV